MHSIHKEQCVNPYMLHCPQFMASHRLRSKDPWPLLPPACSEPHSRGSAPGSWQCAFQNAWRTKAQYMSILKSLLLGAVPAFCTDLVAFLETKCVYTYTYIYIYIYTYLESSPWNFSESCNVHRSQKRSPSTASITSHSDDFKWHTLRTKVECLFFWLRVQHCLAHLSVKLLTVRHAHMLQFANVCHRMLAMRPCRLHCYTSFCIVLKKLHRTRLNWIYLVAKCLNLECLYKYIYIHIWRYISVLKKYIVIIYIYVFNYIIKRTQRPETSCWKGNMQK